MAKKKKWAAITVVIGTLGLWLWPSLGPAEAVVVRHYMTDSAPIYVVDGARLGVFHELNDEGCTVVTSDPGAVADADGDFRTKTGRPIVYINIGGASLRSLGRLSADFEVEAGLSRGPKGDEVGLHQVEWDLAGWRYVGFALESVA
jgi:hypothetical protein